MVKVYERVATWNSKRYDRVFSSSLALELLSEEYQEWLDADGEAYELDALCDIIYVAMGVVWKTNVGMHTMDAAMHLSNRITLTLSNLGQTNMAYLISAHLDIFEREMDYPVLESMANIISAAFSQMLGMGLSVQQVEEAMLIVCDANDSKPVERVAPNVKANKDKGDAWIPPEHKLSMLLERRKNRG